MNNNNSTRLRRITNSFADSAENRITEAGRKIIPVFINDAAAWIMSVYEKWKNSKSLKPKYKDLQK